MILQLRPSPKTFSHPPPLHAPFSMLPSNSEDFYRSFSYPEDEPRFQPPYPVSPQLPLPSFLPSFLPLPIPPYPSSLVPYPPSPTPSKRIRPSEPRCYQRRKRHPQEEACASATESPVVPSEFLALPPGGPSRMPRCAMCQYGPDSSVFQFEGT